MSFQVFSFSPFYKYIYIYLHLSLSLSASNSCLPRSFASLLFQGEALFEVPLPDVSVLSIFKRVFIFSGILCRSSSMLPLSLYILGAHFSGRPFSLSRVYQREQRVLPQFIDCCFVFAVLVVAHIVFFAACRLYF